MTYKTKGTCSREIIFDIENDVLKDVQFVGGCSGQGQGVGKLVNGMKIDEVIDRLKGISCAGRATSCPDQLAKALLEYKENNNQQ